jgi:hypothetical protein
MTKRLEADIVEREKIIKTARVIFIKFYPSLRMVPDELLMVDSGTESKDEALKFFWTQFNMGPTDEALVLILSSKKTEAEP